MYDENFKNHKISAMKWTICNVYIYMYISVVNDRCKVFLFETVEISIFFYITGSISTLYIW